MVQFGRAIGVGILLVWLVSSTAGCASADPESPAAVPAPMPEGSIPFLAVGRAYEASVFAGEWEVSAGRVTVDPEPSMVVQAAEALWWWDGGYSVTLFGHSSRKVIGTGWEVTSVPVPAHSRWAVWQSRDDDRLAIAHAPAVGAGGAIILELRADGNTERIALAPAAEVDAFRTIDVRPAGDGWEVVSEFSRSGIGRIGLMLHQVRGNEVTARVIVEDLPVHEAGAGTNMVRGIDQVYIATQEARVWVVDIGSGKLSSLSAASDRLSRFAADCVRSVEYLVPPMLWWWRDTLIVHWEPAAIEESIVSGEYRVRWLPVACSLAVRDGTVTGELRLVKGILAAYVGDRQETEMTVGEDFPTGWVYPR